MRELNPQNMRGIYGKYKISKADGTPVDPEAKYFVLRYDKDKHARVALEAYARSIWTENYTLAIEIMAELYPELTYPIPPKNKKI